MKAMILAAGLGRRLQAATASKPKALVEIAGRPALAYVIENLIAAGVDQIVINLHYLADQIEDFVRKSQYPAEFHLVYEKELLDTGGAIKNALPKLSDAKEFILHNCDIYTEFDIKNLVSAHHDLGSDATLAVSKCRSERFLWFNQEFNLIGCENSLTDYQVLLEDDPALRKAYDYNCINVVDTSLFRYFDDLPDRFSLFEWFLLAAKQGANIKGFDIRNAYWIDIGTPEDLHNAQLYLNAP